MLKMEYKYKSTVEHFINYYHKNSPNLDNSHDIKWINRIYQSKEIKFKLGEKRFYFKLLENKDIANRIIVWNLILTKYK